jgi:colicin import membrane protein
MSAATAIDRPFDRIYAGLLSLGVHLIAIGLVLAGAWWQQWRSPPPSVAGEPIEAIIWTGPVPGQAPPPRAAPRPTPQPAAAQRRPDTRQQDKVAAITPQPTPERAPVEQRERQRQPRQVDLDAEERSRRERAEAARQALEADRRRQEELQRLRAEREYAERQARLEQERLKQLADLAASQPAAQPSQRPQPPPGNEGLDESLAARYAIAIQQLVTQNWLRPETVRPGLSCRLRIIQIPGGEVISAEVLAPCNADELTRRSIEAAVLRAQPLPYRGFESVFQREIVFNFRYDG